MTEYLTTLKPRYPDITWDVFRSGDHLLDHYKRTPIDGYFDIIYFDIEMVGTNGIDTAAIIRELDKKALFVYVTNHQEYVLVASDTFMFRYLIKPVAWDKFLSVFEDAYNTLGLRSNTFTYTKEYVNTRLHTEDIIYFERLGRKINIHTIAGMDRIWHQIPKLHEELAPFGFVIPHKSFLVNMKYIHKVSRQLLTLRNATEIPIGDTHIDEVRKAFLDYEFKRVNV